MYLLDVSARLYKQRVKVSPLYPHELSVRELKDMPYN